MSHDPYRQARSKEDCARAEREAEWARWERERRRILLRQYAISAVEIAALIAFVCIVAIIVVGVANGVLS